ncbi:PREDICTED: synaptonemal complex protein 2 [Gavialis gangeticus]|uniref:synaptonemal complex protein 2 n=1 Tax=Gavialis gangeticus TaxID=94835 RepID=UPI00092E2533|nr:PREDICTED: synaptonemal complex protein 2 [Gavialis gangeticus]
MPARPDVQLEKCLDDATRKNNFQSLEQFLQKESNDGISHKCSKQFFNKLDKLICRELDEKEVKNVSTLLNSLQKFGKNISIQGEDGIPAMIKYGLVEKMVNWFEKAKEILIHKGNEKNDMLESLIEDFFDVLMIVHDMNTEGKIQILESFILRTCALVADVRINFYIQQEAVRKLNVMLDTMPRDARKKIISTKEMLLIMNDMGKRILDAGDYDLQVAITEALCRMTSEKQRGELARQWFSMEFVTNAFKGIKDSEFETDCRKFLNQVNGILGDKRRVFTYPCLAAVLDKHELQIPLDENLEEFWIDFNVGSRSISFYVAADDEDHQWETVVIPEEDVEMYSLEEKESKKLLTVILKNPMTICNQEGGQILLYFDPVLEIIDVVRKVYGANKCKGFTRKQAISVAKTSVHIIFDESGSQVLVPESQLSPCIKGKSEIENKSNKSIKQQLYDAQKNMNKNTKQDNCEHIRSKIITPSKRKVSEATVVIPRTGSLPDRSPLVFVSTSTPRKGRFKLPLQMMCSSERTNNNSLTEGGIKNLNLEPTGACMSSVSESLKRNNSAEKQMSAEEVLELMQNEADGKTGQKRMLNELLDIVPDSQPLERNYKPLLPGILEISSDENKTWKKRACSVPEAIITSCDKQKTNTSAGHASHQVSILSERVSKQRAFCSIFESTSPKCQSRNIEKKQKSEANKMKEEYCRMQTEQSLTTPKHLEQKILCTAATDTRSIPEITPFKSIHPARRAEKSLMNVDLMEYKGKKGTTNCKSSEKKAKSKEMAEAAESLINKISDRYKKRNDSKCARKVTESLGNNRSLHKSGFSANKEIVQNRSYRNLKTATTLNINAGYVDDVYNFNTSGFDEPTIKLGIQEVHVTKLKASTNPTKKLNPDEKRTVTEKKEGKKARNNQNKKHLFSDTDTEYRGDDSKTDISWLQESSRKHKPQLTDYSRNQNLKKPKRVETTEVVPEAADLMDISKEEKTKNKKVPACKKTSTKTDENRKQTVKPERPRRAALSKKSYKDLSNSESESEEEALEYPVKLKMQKEHENGQSKTVKQKKTTGSTDSKKEVTRKQQIIKKKSEDLARQRKKKGSPVPSTESPASIETVRGSEKLSEAALIQEHIAMERSTSSLQDPTPEKDSLDAVKLMSINMPHATKKNDQHTSLNQSPENTVRNSMFESECFSPGLSPVSLPSLTPVTIDKTVTSRKVIEVSVPDVELSNINEAIQVENYLSGKLAIEEMKDLTKNIVQSKREESLSPSQLTTSSGDKEQSWHKEPVGHIHESGPSIHSNLKRMYCNDIESDSDEMMEMRKEEDEKQKRKIKLLPKKLFKADEDIASSRVTESISTVSINDLFTTDGEAWEPGCSSVGIYQKLHKEFTRKIQSRSRRMDHFNKQSLKTAQQHLTTMTYELHEYRIKQLDKFHVAIMEELESFEKDSHSLKNMEKEFLSFWKKQANTFSVYRRNEQQRIQILKTSFEKNIYQSVEYEENILTSEMHLMKEDMKGLQEKLLKEMQEEELFNVRRGLQTLFLSEGRKF